MQQLQRELARLRHEKQRAAMRITKKNLQEQIDALERTWKQQQPATAKQLTLWEG